MNWEYRIEFNLNEAGLLDSFGKQGWELVSVIDRPAIRWFYFKRPVLVTPAIPGVDVKPAPMPKGKKR